MSQLTVMETADHEFPGPRPRPLEEAAQMVIPMRVILARDF
jgi:hypothetical protein